MPTKSTTVRLHGDTHSKLDERKGDSESFDDVIRKLIDE